MLTLNQPFRSSHWLWLVISAGLVLALGFLPVGSGKGGLSWLAIVYVLVSGDYICPTWMILAFLGITGGIIATMSVVFGWVLHAVVIVLWDTIRKRRRPATHS